MDLGTKLMGQAMEVRRPVMDMGEKKTTYGGMAGTKKSPYRAWSADLPILQQTPPSTLTGIGASMARYRAEPSSLTWDVPAGFTPIDDGGGLNSIGSSIASMSRHMVIFLLVLMAILVLGAYWVGRMSYLAALGSTLLPKTAKAAAT